MVDVLF
jgi:hypothetical protein